MGHHFAQDFKRQISNQRGDALALAMILLVVSIISSLVMIEITRQVESNSMRPRMKSMMAATEAKVRELLLSPFSYDSCTAAGRSSCVLNASKVAALSRKVLGTPCPTGMPLCGIAVTRESWDPMFDNAGVTVSRAVVKIHYEGTEWALADIIVTMDIPADILQQNGIYFCSDPTAPKFNGFNADGSVNCGALPADAGIGQFLDMVRMEDLTTNVTSLPAGPQACAANEVVGHVDWGNGGQTFNYTCVARQNPYTAFGFVPGATAGDAVIVPNTD